MGLFKYWLEMGFCKCSTAVTNWRISQTERKTASFGKTTMEWLPLLCMLMIFVMILSVVLMLPNQKRKTQKSQPTATAPAASTYNVDSQLIENLEKTNSDLLETIGILQGNLSRLMEIRKGTNAQIAGLKKDLEKSQSAIKTLTADYKAQLEAISREVNIRIQEYQQNVAALEYNITSLKKDLEKSEALIKTLTADYETKLKTVNQKAATDLSAQKTSYETKLVTLKAERDKTIRELLAAYTKLIETTGKPNGVKWMEGEIARNQQIAQRLEGILNNKMDDGNYLSGRNRQLYEDAVKNYKEFQALLNGQLKADYDNYQLMVNGNKALNKEYSPR